MCVILRPQMEETSGLDEYLGPWFFPFDVREQKFDSARINFHWYANDLMATINGYVNRFAN